MPTRVEVTVSADANSLAVALKPIGHLTAGGVAQLGASGNRHTRQPVGVVPCALSHRSLAGAVQHDRHTQDQRPEPGLH